MARPKKEVLEQGEESHSPDVQEKTVAKPKFVSDAQKRYFEKIEATKKAKDKRSADVLKQAEELAADFKCLIIPYKDRNEEIVPAIVVGVIDQFKKDKGGQVFDENNEPVMEAVLRVFILSNIDEPRKALYKIDGGK